MKKSPLQIATERFGSKDKLVAAVQALADGGLWIDKVNEDKSLDNVSNRKLLHLHDVLTQVKDEFGDRDGLIGAILKLEKREGDAGYRSVLEGQPTPRLWDAYRAASSRN